MNSTLDSQIYKFPSPLQNSVAACLEAWRDAGNVRRLWGGDARLWTGSDENNWLGWLGIVEEQFRRVDELSKMAADLRGQRFPHVVLIGMGGSSLGPEVLAETFGRQPGGPDLVVLDSTDPAQIRTVDSMIDPNRTLFIVSSKSGTTLEADILREYFFSSVHRARGAGEAGAQFLTITDPGSKLQDIAGRDRFRQVLFGKPNIGGRYSVLSDFGMAPAAAIGVDIARLLAAAQEMVRACGPDVPAADNPGVVLGIIIGVAAQSGRDKLTIVASPGIGGFGAWLEQLIGESTGKQGKGVIAVDGEPPGPPQVYGPDRLFAYLRLANSGDGEDGADATHDEAVAAIEDAGHPVVRINIANRYCIGQEFFRWEIATAVAAAILGVNPFDQPDVEASKVKTRELTAAVDSTGKLPPQMPLLQERNLALFADAANHEALRAAGTLVEYLAAHFRRLRAGDYCALLAYVERNALHHEALQAIRMVIRDGKRVATCVGFGPRFLHSTGQTYKGGPNTGLFLQITCDDAADIDVPGRHYSFGAVKAAQAQGDFEVLCERGRRVLRVHLGPDVTAGLARLADAISQALQ